MIGRVMKHLLLSLALMISANAWSEDYENEIIFYQEFSPLKNEQETAKFAEYYQSIVNKNEPDTLGWKFFKADDKVVEILRWKDSQAIVRHLENVSKGGIFEDDFKSFNEHFAIESIKVYGNVDADVKKMLMDFGLPFEFYPLIAGYSR